MRGAADSNYKGLLLEMLADKHVLAKPKYIHINYGQDHAKVFYCFCRWKTLVVTSKGRTKHEAEQLSSEKIFKYVDANPEILDEELSGFGLTHTKKQLPAQADDLVNNLWEEESFQSLSLLGNAFIREALAYYLFCRFPDFTEGSLTSIISKVMRINYRSQFVKELFVDKTSIVESGEKRAAEYLDAIIGKLVLNGETQAARAFIEDLYQNLINSFVFELLESVGNSSTNAALACFTTTIHNFKNELQEWAQQNSRLLPEYDLIQQNGPSHDPTFWVRCQFAKYTAKGIGKTKKSAEQNAARSMLTYLRKTTATEVRTVWRTQQARFHEMIHIETDREIVAKFSRHIDWAIATNNQQYFLQALTAPSIDPIDNYQRLEFLGDAILKRILITVALEKCPKETEKSFLSPLIDRLVSADTQARVAERLHLDQFILSNTAITNSMKGDVLEAIIAALFLNAANPSDTTMNGSIEERVGAWFKNEIDLSFTSSIGACKLPSIFQQKNSQMQRSGTGKPIPLEKIDDSETSIASEQQPQHEAPQITSQRATFFAVVSKAIQNKKTGKPVIRQYQPQKKVAMDITSLDQFPPLSRSRK